MPDDDITHPIPDLTGYITEGQIVLSRELWGRGVDPPIDVLPCLSRVMNAGIGAGRTRPEHRVVADQLYAALRPRARAAPARHRHRRGRAVGRRARRSSSFADRFETRLVGQGAARRTLDESFDVAWQLLEGLPREELGRLSRPRCSAARRQVGATGTEATP